MDGAATNMLWAELMIEELYRLGCRHVVISPGSRSTPLTLAAAEHPELKTTVHFDERACGFYALGRAKATGSPVALVCTSGTAAANYFSAVIEASIDHVPLVVLTADRPPELHNVGANQSIDQEKLFGDYVRFYQNLPCPDANCSETLPLCAVDQAVAHACAVPAGPVHLNCRFREPFIPEIRIDMSECLSLADWTRQGTPHLDTFVPKKSCRRMESLEETFSSAQRGLVIAGRCHDDDEVQALADFAERLKWPVIADIGSGLRFGFPKLVLVEHYDLLLQDELALAPDLILIAGNGFVSKRLKHWLSRSSAQLIAVQADAELRNPNLQGQHVVRASMREIRRSIRISSRHPSSELMPVVRKWNSDCRQMLESLVRPQIGGLELAESLTALMPSAHGLFLGNSFTVRELDMFAECNAIDIRVCVNRGASGIDGNIATAVGFAEGLARPTSIVLGDVAALHDLNSLALVAQSRCRLIVLVVNNDGGGIFHALPVAAQTEHFEEFFATPHGRRFEQAAAMFDLTYHNVATTEELARAYRRAVQHKGSTLIEIKSDRHGNWQRYQEILGQVEQLLP